VVVANGTDTFNGKLEKQMREKGIEGYTDRVKLSKMRRGSYYHRLT